MDNSTLQKIKHGMWVLTVPMAFLVILAFSSLDAIQTANQSLVYGRDKTLFLRKSTDYLTYLGCAYTTTGDKKFLDLFNKHLEDRKGLTSEILDSKLLDQEEKDLYLQGKKASDELAQAIEKPAFEKLDPKAMYSDAYLEYKSRITDSIDRLREHLNNRSQTSTRTETNMLKYSMYAFGFISLIMVALLRIEVPQMPLKNKIKPKPKTKIKR
jgi:hypothetical protein